MKILVVDDKQEHRLVLESKLKAAGYDMDCAENGIEGLRKLRAEKFDLVITDLMMKEMDGYQFTHAIKTDEVLRHIPVLVYTATYTDAKDEALALNLGANGFILKPATDREFFSEVNRLVEQAGKGALPQRTPTSEEMVYLRQYTERLVRKLQDKVGELEVAREDLRVANASLESRVREATAELRRSNEELEAFVYSVSHDLRSPLRTIEGFVSAVVKNSPQLSAEERQQFLERAAVLAVQGQVLIADLLDYARLKSADLPLMPVSLNEVVSTAVGSIGSLQLSGAKVEVRPMPSKVLAHESTLARAIHNLVTNALKFVRPGVPPHVIISESARNGMVRLNITDHGIGIPAGERQRIFKVFERLHDSRTYPGTGVGLAIVQRAVEIMCGQVGVDSREGEGSTFWIELRKAE